MFPLKLKWLRIFAFEQFVPYLSFEIVKRDKVLFFAWLIFFFCTFISEPCLLSDKEICCSSCLLSFLICVMTFMFHELIRGIEILFHEIHCTFLL